MWKITPNHSPVKVVNNLSADDAYDLVVVLIRKNNLHPIFDRLKKTRNVKNILFLGNNENINWLQIM